MAHKEVENWVSNRQIEMESINRVIYTLSKWFPLCGIEKTIKDSATEDFVGIDLILFPNETFTEITNFPTINVQVKSSEVGLDGFLEKGKRINGEEGFEWQKRRLVVLDGGWGEEPLIADFTAQVGNLMGIWNSPFEMEAFIGKLDPFVRQCYHRTMAKGILHMYKRTEMYAWEPELPEILIKEKNISLRVVLHPGFWPNPTATKNILR
jgi:hypothetical protein